MLPTKPMLLTVRVRPSKGGPGQTASATTSPTDTSSSSEKITDSTLLLWSATQPDGTPEEGEEGLPDEGASPADPAETAAPTKASSKSSGKKEKDAAAGSGTTTSQQEQQGGSTSSTAIPTCQVVLAVEPMDPSVHAGSYFFRANNWKFNSYPNTTSTGSSGGKISNPFTTGFQKLANHLCYAKKAAAGSAGAAESDPDAPDPFCYFDYNPLALSATCTHVTGPNAPRVQGCFDVPVVANGSEHCFLLIEDPTKSGAKHQVLLKKCSVPSSVSGAETTTLMNYEARATFVEPADYLEQRAHIPVLKI
ncbi:unnamed protein product, partial [Amoebophrya sp. A120]|eukprot:GSA120T00026240001.1